MNVKMIVTVSRGISVYEEGTVHDLPQKRAEEWISKEYCVPVDDDYEEIEEVESSDE